MNTHLRSTTPHLCAAALLLGAIVLPGCGGAQYEKRLQGTAKWYGHLARLDRDLVNPAWKDGTVTYFRPPKGFTPQFEEETSDKPVPKVPDFVAGEIDGLRAFWTAELPIESGGSTGVAPGYLYVVDNHHLWTSKSDTKRRAAPTFRDRIGRALAREFGLQAGNVDNWVELRLPEPEGYGTSRSFKTIVETLPNPIGEWNYELSAYAFVSGDVQGAAIFLVPTNSRNKQKLDATIELSIQTLEVMTNAPTLIAKPGGTTSGDF